MARGLQKAQSQLKNAGDQGKTPEQRAADRKNAIANTTAYVCQFCRQTFANTAKEPMLREHWTLKHGKEPVDDVAKAFPSFKFGAAAATTCPPVKAAATTAGGAPNQPTGDGSAKKVKAKNAAEIAAAALAAANKPAKKTKEKPAKESAAPAADMATGAEPEPAPEEIMHPASGSDCDPNDNAVEEAASVIENPARVVSEEAKVAIEKARMESVAIEATYGSKKAAEETGALVLATRALLGAGKGVGIKSAELDSLMVAADIEFVIKS